MRENVILSWIGNSQNSLAVRASVPAVDWHLQPQAQLETETEPATLHDDIINTLGIIVVVSKHIQRQIYFYIKIANQCC